MQWKYCDFCGNISIKPTAPGSRTYKCSRCDWEGFPREGSMETINVKARAYRPGTKWLAPAPLHSEDGEDCPDFGDGRPAKADGSEFSAKIRPSTATGKIPKNQELKDRLKGRTSLDSDFL